MKILFGLTLLFAVCGCTQSPTISNPTITQTFQIAPPQVNSLVSGTFTDLSTNPYTMTPFSLSTSVSSGTWIFQTGKHDTVDFTVTFNTPAPNTPVTFSYALGSTQTSAATDGNGNYTSSQITF
jgi:hypothetical protein